MANIVVRREAKCSGSDTALQSKLKHRMIGDYKSGGLW